MTARIFFSRLVYIGYVTRASLEKDEVGSAERVLGFAVMDKEFRVIKALLSKNVISMDELLEQISGQHFLMISYHRNDDKTDWGEYVNERFEEVAKLYPEYLTHTIPDKSKQGSASDLGIDEDVIKNVRSLTDLLEQSFFRDSKDPSFIAHFEFIKRHTQASSESLPS